MLKEKHIPIGMCVSQAIEQFLVSIVENERNQLRNRRSTHTGNQKIKYFIYFN